MGSAVWRFCKWSQIITDQFIAAAEQKWETEEANHSVSSPWI